MLLIVIMNSHSRNMEEESGSETVCFVCERQLIDDTVKVTDGLANLIQVSKERKDEHHLMLEEKTSILMHRECRKKYIMKRKNVLGFRDLTPAVSKPFSHLLSPKKKKSRFSEPFDLSSGCMFCKSSASSAKDPLRLVQDPKYQKEVLALIQKNISNDECKALLEQISNVDLVGVAAKYHKNCRGKFTYTFGKSTHVRAPGRPFEDQKLCQFAKIVDHIAATGESIYNLTELTEIGGNFSILLK